ncbi:unnamed protein product [Phytomonas sp. EM1]|nr:unnamed protein product [Phytomonas sp. EM1]|eukprot:CCW63816.1 unnamed protein product [Phytomonas sp. isolate EM1]
MAPDKESKNAKRVWGKRPRDGGNQHDGSADKAFVRFSELSPKEKLQRRKMERIEKKERDRNMSYFMSVQRTIEEYADGNGDTSVLAGIVDGFFVELMKLLKADRSFNLLCNAKICRVIELALKNSPLLHCKSLLYVFLGRIHELITSPVASYMLETLFASMSRELSNLEDNQEGLTAEMVVGGPGIHVESGVPSTATLLNSAVEELCESAGDMLVHEVGSRALRSIILVLGGFTVHNEPPLARPVRFTGTLGMLATAVVSALEEGYGRQYGTRGPAEAWMAAAQDPTCSFVVQSLLRVSENRSPTDLAVRQRLEKLRCNSKPLLRELLLDPMGVHIFQAYLKVPTPEAVINAGDSFSLYQHTGPSSSADCPVDDVATKSKRCPRPVNQKDDDKPSQDGLGGERAVVWSKEQLLDECCWGKAMQLTQSELGQLLDAGSERVAQTGYVLQDLALYSPTAAHLQLLWERVIHPHLLRFTEIHALGGVLTALLKKCAFSGLLVVPKESEGATSGAASPCDLTAVLRQDESKGVRYFSVPLSFEQLVTKELCMVFKGAVTKGAAQYLLVERRLGERGYELARYILHLRHPASVLLRHGIDKLRLEDVLNLCKHHKGSLVLQQYLRASSSTQSPVKPHASRDQDTSVNAGSGRSESKLAVDSVEKGEVVRFFRRIQSHIADLVGDKYAAFVIEVLYEVASIGLKETIVKALVPIHEALKTTSNTETEEDVSSKDAASRSFISHKVLRKCCVEQYIYRQEDWRKAAQLQCRVQRLLQSIVLDG